MSCPSFRSGVTGSVRPVSGVPAAAALGGSLGFRGVSFSSFAGSNCWPASSKATAISSRFRPVVRRKDTLASVEGLATMEGVRRKLTARARLGCSDGALALMLGRRRFPPNYNGIFEFKYVRVDARRAEAEDRPIKDTPALDFSTSDGGAFKFRYETALLVALPARNTRHLCAGCRRMPMRSARCCWRNRDQPA